MVYFLVHKGTQKVFFEKRENLLATLEKSIDLAERECLDGFNFNITIGCTKNIEQYGKTNNE